MVFLVVDPRMPFSVDLELVFSCEKDAAGMLVFGCDGVASTDVALCSRKWGKDRVVRKVWMRVMRMR